MGFQGGVTLVERLDDYTVIIEATADSPANLLDARVGTADPTAADSAEFVTKLSGGGGQVAIPAAWGPGPDKWNDGDEKLVDIELLPQDDDGDDHKVHIAGGDFRPRVVSRNLRVTVHNDGSAPVRRFRLKLRYNEPARRAVWPQRT